MKFKFSNSHDFIEPDGVHINKRGAEKISDTIEQKISEIINKNK